ncbi:MAG: hypothetical protein AAGE85_00210 [Pseudomonadota bacterium]
MHVVLLLSGMLVACAGRTPAPVKTEPVRVSAVEDPGPVELECEAPELQQDNAAMLDSTQVRIERLVYNSSRWFDGLFGSSSLECAGNVSRGYLGAGLRWDQRDGTRFRGRLRAKVALPAVSRRTRLIVGRGDADGFIDGSDEEDAQSLPDRFTEFDDQEFVLGLGYSRADGLRRGWDLGAGIKFSTPLDPYARVRYDLNPLVAERWLWRVSPQVFWQDSRGSGVSLINVVDFAASRKWLFRSWTSLVEDKKSEGLEWASKFTAYYSISRRSALGLSAFRSGEREAEVSITDYGFELRYRRSVLREWFFVELLTSVSYPRELAIEERRRNFGVGVEFELQFGHWPERQ